MTAPLSRSRGVDKLPRMMYNTIIGDARLKKDETLHEGNGHKPAFIMHRPVHNSTKAPTTGALYQNCRLFSKLHGNSDTMCVRAAVQFFFVKTPVPQAFSGTLTRKPFSPSRSGIAKTGPDGHRTLRTLTRLLFERCTLTRLLIAFV